MTTADNLDAVKPAEQAQAGRAAVPARTDSRLATLARRVPRSAWKYLLVGSDALLIFLAFVSAYGVRYQAQLFIAVDPTYYLPFAGYLPLGFSSVVVLLVAFRFSRVYPYRPGRSWLEETWRIATASTAGVIILIVASLILRPMLYSRLVFLYTALLVTVYLGFSRLLILWARSICAPMTLACSGCYWWAPGMLGGW